MAAHLRGHKMREFPYLDFRGKEQQRRTTTATESWTLQHSKPANNQCKITAGTVTLGGVDLSVSETTVDLSGATEFVYVKVIRATSVVSVNHASVRPQPDSTNFYLILVSFAATDGVYDSGTIHHRGDYNAQAIL